jgi:hypothetical protein
MQALPAGTYSFQKIIQENMLYADKTEYIYKILKNKYNYCFLSRPRRFGKTLLLSTIQEFFAGDRELFKNLWIYSSDFDFIERPVIRFDMSYMKDDNKIDLSDNIIVDIMKFARIHNIGINHGKLSRAIEDLLIGLKKKYNQEVVILIDEYDYPISHFMSTNIDMANLNVEILHDFYTTLKKLYENIYLVFVTGVTKFAMTALASGANNYIDISLDQEFSGICGFTIEEFDLLFADYLTQTIRYLPDFNTLPLDEASKQLRQEIFNYYNGYNWMGKSKVLNPFSIICFFNKKIFDTYWYSTGQLKQLANIMQNQLWDTIHPELTDYLYSEIQNTEIGSLRIVPMLFHYGYLTIDSVITKKIPRNNGKTIKANYCTFKIPNDEVDLSFKNDIYQIIAGINNFNIDDDTKDIMSNALLHKDIKITTNLINSIFSTVVSYKQTFNEQFFQALLHIYLVGAQFNITSKQSSTKGRLDLLIDLNATIYIIIIKIKYIKYHEGHDESQKNFLMDEKCNEALEQIENQGYDQPEFKPKKIIKMALVVYGKGSVMVKFAPETT